MSVHAWIFAGVCVFVRDRTGASSCPVRRNLQVPLRIMRPIYRPIVFDHFVGLSLKGLKNHSGLQILILIFEYLLF